MKIFLLLIVAVIIIPNVVGWARRRRLGTERNSKIGNLTKLVSTTAVPLWEETDVLTKLLQELDEKVMDAEADDDSPLKNSQEIDMGEFEELFR